MKHHLFLIAFLLLTAFCGHAQDSLQTGISHDSSIHATLVQGNKYPNLVYTANGEVLSDRDIVRRLTLYTEPADELEKYNNYRTGRFVWLGVMVAGVAGAAVEKSQNNAGGAVTFAGVFLGGMIGTFVSAIRAEVHLKQAIKIYNRRFSP